MRVSKFRKICIFLLALFLVFSPIVLFNFSNKEKIEKEINISKNNNLKHLEQEGQNYRLVTSADNVQVPVPKGYVASNVTGENYVSPQYQHTTNTYKVSATQTELTWSSPEGEQYPWTQDENGIWISGNQGIQSSESVLESEEFDYIKGTTLKINYTYSSQTGDYLCIDLINLTNNTTIREVEAYGNTGTAFNYITSNYTVTINDWRTGRYKIKVIYKKNSSIDQGQDSGYIKTSTYFKEDENGTQIFNEDIKTKIHDGGFVIYQLTDEELETDPNGTNVIINDTNKDDEQSERNQYVWVPVPNVEDIIRIKALNNGIMQFGQGYEFYNTSIEKETNINSDTYREPKLANTQDKTKYYLQRYSKLDKRENYLNEQQEEFKNMISSIEKYKGFYIGRYETGDDYTHDFSEKSFINPKIVRYNTSINNVTWYDSYKDLQRLSRKTEKYVETGMLYDGLWDYTLKWLNETDARSYVEINKDSGTWGNYKNNGFTYKTSADGTENTKKPTSKNRITPTGGITEILFKGEKYSESPTASNNIFDIAGNICEWTMAISRVDRNRRSRGGYNELNSKDYPADSVNDNTPNLSSSMRGARAQLYIK